MTAPIVWHTQPLLIGREREWYEWWADADSRNGALPDDRPAGQLWERLAEYTENHS